MSRFTVTFFCHVLRNPQLLMDCPVCGQPFTTPYSRLILKMSTFRPTKFLKHHVSILLTANYYFKAILLIRTGEITRHEQVFSVCAFKLCIDCIGCSSVTPILCLTSTTQGIFNSPILGSTPFTVLSVPCGTSLSASTLAFNPSTAR